MCKECGNKGRFCGTDGEVKTPNLSNSDVAPGYMRKAFICKGCKHVYMDNTVSLCDCGNKAGYDEYEVEFTKINSSI